MHLLASKDNDSGRLLWLAQVQRVVNPCLIALAMLGRGRLDKSADRMYDVKDVLPEHEKGSVL